MKRKVLAYITRDGGGEILVFRHVDYPDAGIQVPAGTLEEGEELLSALFREVAEESGLQNGLHLVGPVSTSPYFSEAKGEWQERNIFHIISSDPLPDSWVHVVTAGEEDSGLLFEYFWMPIRDAIDSLAGAQGTSIPMLIAAAE